ncbi:aminotransferase class V-fold PLP-dependent enzyme [Streptacidiphilus rugosus]|uniref:aminotransferase class V-fold PLP-dependent enzyme n=1 Tax=Streptacidiphilus rugosus TaxID=405783 RepID=UPI00056BDF43|nr:aminotransferase class V-fold PLP-dependent enzyme [Streptacidiphilus rugosus]
MQPDQSGTSHLDDVVAREFAPESVYLNSASMGLPPARTVAALREGVTEWAAGWSDPPAYDAPVGAARRAFARLAGAGERQVAIGSTASEHAAVVAASLPAGSQVLFAEGEFTSVMPALQHRGDLRVRAVPLERLAESVDADTALVAVSIAQSADGRVADPAELRAATRRHGARLLLDASQSAGWLPLPTGDDRPDYLVCAAYKWLLAPRGASFFAVTEDAMPTLRVIAPSWYAGEDPWTSCYDEVPLAASARRFDRPPAWLPFVGAAQSLSLIEEVTPAAIGAHDRALAARCREGLRELGHAPVAADSAIVSVPGVGDLAKELAAAGIRVSARAGGLRIAFHLYNSAADVDALLARLPARAA